MPSLSVLIPQKEKERSSLLKADNLSATEGSLDEEICQSPSWSQFGGGRKKKEKKRVEKETRDLEKQVRKEKDEGKQVRKEKEEEVQKTAGKASKRLNKKPPAAMDTQRMPAALRRLSSGSRSGSQPTSTDASRRSSQEERRSSVSSISSFVQRWSPVSAKSFTAWPDNSGPIVSETAPQLPKLSGIETHPHSRRVSSSESAILDDDEEHSYKKDLVEFAYRLRTLSFGRERNVEPANADRISTPSSSKSQPFVTPPTSQNNTNLDLPKNTLEIPVAPAPVKPSFTERRASDGQDTVSKQDRSHRGSQHPGRIKPRSDDRSNEGEKSVKAQGHRDDSAFNRQNAHGSEASPMMLDNITSQIMSSIDGSSYVHKQRMHQQQRSIASYEDQMALSDSMQRTDGYDSIYNVNRRWPPTPTDSSESIQKSPRASPTRQGKPLEKKITLNDGAEDQHHALPTDMSRHPTNTGISQSSGAPKADKTQDVQRRPKLEALSVSSESTDTVTAGQSKRNPYSPTSPPSPVSPISVVSVSTVLKSEGESRISVPNPLTMNPHRGRNDVRTHDLEAPPIAPIFSIPERSPKRAVHAVLASKILPRSLTAPNLTSLPTSVSHQPLQKPASDSIEKSPVAPSSTKAPTLPSNNNNEAPPPAIPSDAPPRKADSEPPSTKRNLESIPESPSSHLTTRKPSLKRPRSNPTLQIPKSATLPSLDFLPELKHQPLTKPKRATPPTTTTTSTASTSPNSTSYAAMSQFPLPSSVALSKPTSSPYTPSSSSPLRTNNNSSSATRRRTTPTPTTNTIGAPGAGPAGNNGLDVKPIAKMFVICCQCKFWHDLPSRLYEAMAKGERMIEGTDGVARSVGARNGVAEAKRKLGLGGGVEAKGKGKGKDAGVVETRVRCPWCEHGMSTGCCAGWTTVVYLHERHH